MRMTPSTDGDDGSQLSKSKACVMIGQLLTTNMTSFLSRATLARRATTQTSTAFVCYSSCGLIGSSSSMMCVTNSLGTAAAAAAAAGPLLLCQSQVFRDGRPSERFHSTAASKESSSSSNSFNSSSPSSLRHLIRPFLLKCHPDAVQNFPDAKRLNLVAIQTLNAFVDSMDDVMARSIPAQKLKEEQWPKSIAIEYLLPLPDPMLGRQKKARPPTLARRRIELALPSWKLRQQVLASTPPAQSTNILDDHGIFRNKKNHSDQTRSLRQFQWQVQRELAKLVNSAGLAVSPDFVPASPTSVEHLDQDALHDFLLDRDGGDDDNVDERPPAFGHRRYDAPRPRVVRHPPTKREINRNAFMSRVNWKRQEEAYQQALRGMEEDLMTEGLISDNPTRKQKYVDQVLARVRVQRKKQPASQRNETNDFTTIITNTTTHHDKNDHNDISKDDSDVEPSSQIKNDTEGQVKDDAKGQGNDDQQEEEEEEDPYELVPVLDQLIALRRLSLLLFDNFNELQMEDMGNVWDHIVIVLTAPRIYNTSSSAMNRRRQQQQQRKQQQHHLAPAIDGSAVNGFMFSYDTNHRVTVHVPVDFTDVELLDELKRNLHDFYEMLDHQLKSEIYPDECFVTH